MKTTLTLLLLALMCCSCRTVSKALANDFERKVGEITAEKVDALVEAKIGKLIVDYAPEGIMGLLITALSAKLALSKKKEKEK